jgi:general secretion pathway protein K
MRAPRSAGIALISVVWVLALLCVMAAGVGATLRGDTQLAANLVASTQARHAAEAGVHLALFQVAQSDGKSGWLADGTIHELGLGAAMVRIAASDEAGKIDLNVAPAAVLDGLLRTAGIAEGERSRLVDAILDWRDADSDPGPYGAEEAQYRVAGKPYGPRNGPFESVDELRLVLGISPALYRGIAAALTVHSRQPGIVAESATRQVLLAIPGAEVAEIDRYVDLRALHREAGLLAPAPPDALRPYTTRNGNGTLAIHSQARLKNGVTAHATATVDLRRPGLDSPFSFRDWRDDGPELFPVAH